MNFLDMPVAWVHNAGMSSVLDKEMETFRRQLPGLLADARNVGRFVLIIGEAVAGVFDTQNEAIEVGYETFGIVPLLAKQIVEHEEPIFFPGTMRAVSRR